MVSDEAKARRAGQMRSLLFFPGFALLVAHEFDAVEQAEWRLLPLLNLMPDDTAYVVFVALHWFLSSDPLYTFHSSLSNALIVGGGLVGLLHLVLLLRGMRARGAG